VPESFLTHVLLADQAQDSVRKILFEPKLDKDLDESGRERLVAALGALAQDQLFKTILDQATESMQRAFTPKGQRKRSAGSPWLEAIERSKALRAKKDQLEAQVKDTDLVEARIKDLHGRHDSVAGELTDAEEAHRVAVRQLDAQHERDVLHGEVQSLQQRIRDAESMAKQIEAASGEATKLESDAAAARDAAKQAAERAAHAETELSILRRQLDAALHDDPDTERKLAELQAEVSRTESRMRDALTVVSAAKDAMQIAGKLAADLAAEDTAVKKTSALADAADAAVSAASREVDRAGKALADAQERQRDARSSDRARVRELRRKDLDNRALSLASKRSQIDATLQRAQQVVELSAHGVKADAAVRATRDQLAVTHGEIAACEADHAELDAARTVLAQLHAYGRFRQLREELAKATQAGEEADRERQRAAELRGRAAQLRSEVRSGLPTAERVQELDGLRQQVQLAEAALGGGLSVEIRPKQSLTVRSTRDGVADRAATGSELVALTAKRSIALAIDDLLDIEITAGEDAARRTAADLRARWLREGESVLVEHGFASLEELRLARARSDAALRDVADALREAENADKRASLVGNVDVAAIREQLAAAESELGAADREDLAIRFARLGASWQTGLRTRSAELEAQLESSRAKLGQRRAGVAKLEAQLAVQQNEAARFEAEIERAQAELTEPWTVVVTTSKADQQTIAAEQEDIQRHLAALATGASEEEAAADAAVVAAGAALQTVEANAQAKRDAAQTARMAQVRASTRLDGIRMTARQLDAQGVWAARLDGGDASLPVDAWEAAVKRAEHQLETARAAHADATAASTDARIAHDSAVQTLRKKAQDADDASSKARSRSGAAEAHHKELIAKHAAAVVSLSEMKVKVAGIHVDELQAEIARRRTRMVELEPKTGRVDQTVVTALEEKAGRLRAELRELDEDLAKAKGALEQVGGAVVRERLAEIGQAIQQAEQREHEVEIEYEAWRLLHDTLRQAETTESAHLGRALAGPVGTRFRQLTGGRYGDIELGAQIEAGGIHVAGGLREIAALSAGTQDQLATLLRVCIAQQLRSAIILDDHLTQSDPARVAWFNTMLREAAESVQIILITCRPHEVLAPDELCGPGQTRSATADGRVHAVDLAAVIRRFDVMRPTTTARRTRELEEA
jgi:chromosome segregation ATPase